MIVRALRREWGSDSDAPIAVASVLREMTHCCYPCDSAAPLRTFPGDSAAPLRTFPGRGDVAIAAPCSAASSTQVNELKRGQWRPAGPD
jgi:hypothetical protein